MDKIKELSTLEEIKIFSVPYRTKILECMYSLRVPATVKNIADHMGETPAKIHYHIKKMEEAGIVNLVYTENINGIIAKFYEPSAQQFQIIHKSGQVEDTAELLNETQRVVTLAYDENKKSFLKQLSRTDKEHSGFVSGEEFYLTKEEYNEMRKEIENVIKKYSLDANREDKTKYTAFISLIDAD